MNNVMIDLETMGNGPNAAIIAIGAVEFDIENKIIVDRFYSVVDLESSVVSGGVIDSSTVIWWMQQGDDARKEFLRKGEHISSALHKFSVWMERISSINDVCVWGNGAAFDNVILSSAYKRNGTIQPWHFWNDRCYRTIKAQNPDIKMKRSGTHHNAVDDAESQALHLIEIFSVTS